MEAFVSDSRILQAPGMVVELKERQLERGENALTSRICWRFRITRQWTHSESVQHDMKTSEIGRRGWTHNPSPVSPCCMFQSKEKEGAFSKTWQRRAASVSKGRWRAKLGVVNPAADEKAVN